MDSKHVFRRILSLSLFLSIAQSIPANENISSGAVEIKNICGICFCDPKLTPFLINCSEQKLQDHFNDDDWFETLKQQNITSDSEVKFDVRFDDNQITEIKKFPSLPIESLSFKNNKIANISDSAFENLEKLSVLDLSQNLLSAKNLPEQVFFGHYNVTTWKPLTIQSLNLSYNNIFSVEKDLFDHFPNLISLDLSHNKLKILGSTSMAISDLPKLKYLSLAYTQISEITPGLLHQLEDLQSLDLSGNKFTKIPEELRNAHKLLVLNLDDNKFESFDEDSFQGLDDLEELSISNMKSLRLIERSSFGPLIKLKKLYCCHNKNLDRIHNAAFYNTTDEAWSLMELYLNDNALQHLDEGLADWVKIRTIDIQNNPFRCDCELQWMAEELVSQIHRSHPQLTYGVRCNEPKELRGDSILELGMEPQSFAKCHSGSRNSVRSTKGKASVHPAAATTVLVIGIILIVIGFSILGVLIVKKKAIAMALIHHHQIRYQRTEDDDDEQGIYKSSASGSRFNSL